MPDSERERPPYADLDDPNEGHRSLAVDLLLRLLGAETGNPRVVPAHKLDEYGSTEAARTKIAALTHARVHSLAPDAYQLYGHLIYYNAADQTFVAKPMGM
jgi:hypothetical protein